MRKILWIGLIVIAAIIVGILVMSGMNGDKVDLADQEKPTVVSPTPTALTPLPTPTSVIQPDKDIPEFTVTDLKKLRDEWDKATKTEKSQTQLGQLIGKKIRVTGWVTDISDKRLTINDVKGSVVSAVIAQAESEEEINVLKLDDQVTIEGVVISVRKPASFPPDDPLRVSILTVLELEITTIEKVS